MLLSVLPAFGDRQKPNFALDMCTTTRYPTASFDITPQNNVQGTILMNYGLTRLALALLGFAIPALSAGAALRRKASRTGCGSSTRLQGSWLESFRPDDGQSSLPTWIPGRPPSQRFRLPERSFACKAATGASARPARPRTAYRGLSAIACAPSAHWDPDPERHPVVCAAT